MLEDGNVNEQVEGGQRGTFSCIFVSQLKEVAAINKLNKVASATSETGAEGDWSSRNEITTGFNSLNNEKP